MEHTPATPLPWIVNLRRHVVTADASQDAAHCKGSNGVEDAAYIAHAANAYPRLVEALRKVAIGKPYAERSADLLRELGEL